MDRKKRAAPGVAGWVREGPINGGYSVFTCTICMAQYDRFESGGRYRYEKTGSTPVESRGGK